MADSGEGITTSVTYALKEMGFPVPPPEILRRFVGPPLFDSYREFCGMNPEEVIEAVRQYRVYYNVEGIWMNTIYPGIPETLAALKAAGCQVLLATSKPEEAAARILEHYNLAQYFDVIAGASQDDSRSRKADVIAYALERCGVTDFTRVVMVGDREFDVLGAREHGIPCVGVLFGYGDREELEKAGAVAVAEDAHALTRILLA